MRAAFATLLAGLACAAGCGQDDAPEGRVRDDRLTVFFAPALRPDRAAVVGDFNGWDPAAAPMSDPDGDGIYRAVLEPPAGDHLYRIWADGQTFLDAYNPLTLFGSDEIEYSFVRVPDPDQPSLEVSSFEAGADGELSVELSFLRGRSDSPLRAGSIQADLEDGTTVDVLVEEGETIRLSASGLATGKHRLEISAADRRGKKTNPHSLPFWVEPKPFDWRDALIYQVMVDRFRKGGGRLDPQAGISSFQGGDLAGVVEEIEQGYFDALGVNALWISPMYRQPEGSFIGRDGYPAEGYHGYWPVAARQVEQRFGGEEGLDALVSAAHARGIRVIMDTVPNQVHAQHEYVSEHAGRGWVNDPLGDCVCGVTCSWADHMQDCWFDPFLPDLRWRNPAVVEQITSDLVWWLERFDLDGLRIDAVPMMPRLAVRHLRARVDGALGGAGPPVYLLGETYTFQGGQDQIRTYLGPHGLSGQFDYPVLWVLRDALTGKTGLDALAAEVEASQDAWAGSGAVMAPVVGSHDTARLISVLAQDQVNAPREAPPPQPSDERAYDLQRLALTFLLTQPGAPVIYYGDEIGLAGGEDPDNRRAMLFSDALSAQQAAVLAHARRLGRARACSRALRRGAIRTLFAILNLYAFARSDEGGRPALVVLNPTTGARPVELDVPSDWPLEDGAAFVDLFGASVQTDGRRVTLEVPPMASAVLLSEPACIGGAS